MAHSYNSIPVKIMIDIGRKAIIETAHKAGIRGELENWAPMVLGTSALSLLDLTTGYVTFANGGKVVEPYGILEIRKANGDVVYSRGQDDVQPPRQVFPESVIADLNSMLAAVVKAGTGRRADLGFAPQGGKTGTNQSYRDAWYIGFTAHNVTGVWFGNDDYSAMNEVTGGLLPAPTWKQIMLTAESGLQPEAVAGIPYDDSYAVASADVPSSPVAVAVAPPTDETDQASGDSIPASAQPDDVSQVLNGMFNLFEENPAPAKPKPRKVKQQALVLPKANTDEDTTVTTRTSRKRSFFEKIFGGDDEPPPRQKRKKKTLFEIY